jgi:hypothetical protein
MESFTDGLEDLVEVIDSGSWHRSNLVAPLFELPAVSVIVVARDDDSRSWLDTAQIQSDVELKLRGAGMKVTSTAQPHFALLVIEAGWFSYGEGDEQGLYSVSISVHEEAILERDPSIKLLAQTWIRQQNQDGPSGELATLRAMLSDLADTLIDDYFSANPQHTDKVH